MKNSICRSNSYDDEYLYEAVNSGRRRWSFFDDSCSGAEAISRMKWVAFCLTAGIKPLSLSPISYREVATHRIHFCCCCCLVITGRGSFNSKTFNSKTREGARQSTKTERYNTRPTGGVISVTGVTILPDIHSQWIKKINHFKKALHEKKKKLL